MPQTINSYKYAIDNGAKLGSYSCDKNAQVPKIVGTDISCPVFELNKQSTAAM